MKATDLIIIGAGPGGYETAILAAKAGLQTVIIEADKAGGTCLNAGCIPTKCFCRNAEILQNLKDAETFGITANYCFDFQKAVERKNQVVANLNNGIESLLKHPLITRVNGKASFVNTTTVCVEKATNRNGEPIETEYTAKNIIIATGSVTKFLPIEGAHLPKVLTSTEMLNLDRIPLRLCIIGGGVIGLEFASIFNAFGSEVTVVEFCKEILPNFDSDIAKRLKPTLKSKGINIINQAAVSNIREEGKNYVVSYDTKGKTMDIETDLVLMAVGRGANLASLNLAEIGIATERKGISVDDNMLTNISGIYAIGDINGRCQLAHAAYFQGRRALNHLLGKTDNIRFDIMPAAVFTNPEAATVGLTEDYCKANGMICKTHKAFFRSNGKALSMNEPEGMVKIITDEAGKLLGCHLFGAHAADLIQEITALLCKNSTLDELYNIIHAHPTLGEVVMNAAEA
ncbi:MAG: dihydrolipoyl dehydrogenase [Bacteroidaceae bacterium]